MNTMPIHNECWPMRALAIRVLLVALLLSAAVPSRAASEGAVATGKYRNLFVEAGHSSAEVSQKITNAFAQFFHGQPASEALFYSAGTNSHGPLAYIYDVAHDDVRSEGMSYGMMIAVQLDHRQEFDALWNWSRSRMYHTATNHPARGYFIWSVTTNGIANDEMPAADGEEYFTTALYFAAARWGSSTGIYAYRAEADRLLKDMRGREQITGPTQKGMMTGVSLFHPELAMVRFTPDLKNSEHTDPSYHLPAFYEVWARCAPQSERAYWAKAATASRDFFQRAAHPKTGLTPEYANFDGTSWSCDWSPRSDEFQFDAWRTAMNWSVDWSWWAQDARERDLSDRLQIFFGGQGMGTYANHYTLEGRPVGADHSTGLVAMNAVASLASTRPQGRDFVEALWNAPVPAGQWRYYDGMLYLLALLHCGGEFRVWMPEWTVGSYEIKN